MKRDILQKLRKPESNRSIISFIVTAVIFGMIIVTFVFMSPNGGGQLSGSATAATVGGKVIPIIQLQRKTQEIEQRNKMFIPNPNEQFQKFFQSQALNELINAEILTEVQYKEGLYIPDALLAQTIMDIPSFQEKGQFQRDLYETYLTNAGESASSLEERIKKDLRVGQLRELFDNSFLTTQAEKKVYSEIVDFPIKMDVVDVSESVLAPKTNITAEDVKKAEADPAVLKRAQELFDRESFKYQTKEKVKAKWIVVLKKDPSAAASQEAKIKLEEGTKDLTVQNFSEIAKKVSEDPTAAQGGDLGFVERGTLDEDWDNVAFATSVGSISKPFEIEQGWARVFIDEKTKASKSTFKDVQTNVVKEVLLADKYKQIIESLKKTANENPKSLDSALAANGLKWQPVADFKLSADEIPGFGKADLVFEKLMTLKKDGDVYGDVVPNEGKTYLIKRRQFDLKADPNADLQNLVGNRENYALGGWFETQKENIRIKVNPSLN